MSGYVGPQPSPLDLLPGPPGGSGNALQDYVDQLSHLHGFTSTLPAPSSWPYANNPVGTETTQSMGAPSAANDQVAYVTSGGVPVMASQLAAAHAQLAQAKELAPTMALGMIGDAPGGGAAAAAGSPGAQALRVYHGTPHLFPPVPDNPLGAFDLSKIGSGEGAQVYGHGIYVAENPATARSYRESVQGESTFDMSHVLGKDAEPVPAGQATWMINDILRDHPDLEHVDEGKIEQGAEHVVSGLAEGMTPDQLRSMSSRPLILRDAEGTEVIEQGLSMMDGAKLNYAGPTVGGKPFDAGDPTHKAAVYVHEAGGDPDAAIARLDGELADMQERAENARNPFGPIPSGHYNKAMRNVMELKNLIDQQRGDLPVYKPPGHMYEADITRPADDFLHWDKSFSEQSPQVQAGLRKLGIGPPEAPKVTWEMRNGAHVMLKDGVPTGNEYRPTGVAGQWQQFVGGQPFRNTYRGTVLVNDLDLEMRKANWAKNTVGATEPGGIGSNFYSRLGAPAAASERLRDAGIPGIRYFDQLSRGAGGPGAVFNWQQKRALLQSEVDRVQDLLKQHDGDPHYQSIYQQSLRQAQAALRTHEANEPRGQTHNFVMFDPSFIKIVKRYGIGALIPGAGATGLLAGGNEQQ